MVPFRLLPAVLLTLGLAGSDAAAQEAPAPACLAGREGVVACLAGTLCACRYDPGGSISGRAPGYRWDCGALRPSCGVVPPAGPGGDLRWSWGELPPVILGPGGRHRSPAQDPWMR
jgi:hypothetical protein